MIRTFGKTFPDLFIRHLISSYFLPDIVLGTGVIKINESDSLQGVQNLTTAY